MTRRVIQLSGAASATIASIAARKPSPCDRLRRAERPCSQSPNRAASALASSGASRARSIHNSGLSTLDDRAKVSRVNRSRRSRADARVDVVDLQQHRLRRAQVGVERVVLLLLGGELGARRIGDRRLLRLRRQFGEALGGSFEARRQIDDDRLQLGGERVAGGAQAHEIGIGEVVRLQRRFDVGDGRMRRIEGLARRVVAGGAGRARGDEQGREQQAEGANGGQTNLDGDSAMAASEWQRTMASLWPQPLEASL